MKFRMISILALALVICGCGANSAPNGTVATQAESTANASETADTLTTEETNAETAADTTETTAPADQGAASGAVADADAAPGTAFTWFKKGVYALENGGIVQCYYVFEDETNGRTEDTMMEIGCPFTCEQYKEKIVFHMGSTEDNSVMTMELNELEEKVGTMNGTTYFFREIAGADPATFSGAEEYAKQRGDMGLLASDPYSGSYVEEVAGRGVVSITALSNNRHAVHVYWSSSAADYYEWDFTGEFTGRQVLNYTDCVKKHFQYDEEGNETVETEYTDGTGYIKVNDFGLTWHDEKEGVAEDSNFLRSDS